MAEEILVRQDGPILRITLNAPDRGNAVTDDNVRQLTRLIREAPEKVDIIVLRGAGQDFCVGRAGMGARPAVEPSMGRPKTRSGITGSEETSTPISCAKRRDECSRYER